MEVYNDVFISYGRKHSKNFATKLHNDLVDRGIKVWFDQNDIPLGVDFQNQIDDGIEKAHNFCFIISPHSVRSEYCGKEIILAKQLKKRIIPILHVEPKDDWDKMDELIAKLNWIYFREGEDDYDKSFEGLTALISSESNYVEQHTDFLVKARDWARANRTTNHLLVGAERQQAERWLLTEFLDRQPPTVPTELHAEFITESKKNANNLQTDVFISYDRTNVNIRDVFRLQLALKNITSWTDTGDIKTGVRFEEAIQSGVELADNFFFLISPASVTSEFCIWELDWALKYHKRVIPIMIEHTPDADIPEQLSKIQYLTYQANNPEACFSHVFKILEEDHDYYNKSKIFLAKALKWERQHKNESILLRGYNLEKAETWLKLSKQRRKDPPLPLHEEFISESATRTADMTTEVFVSYSRKDSDFARQLNERLQMSGKTTWFDQESIAAGTDFAAEIYKGIDTSDNFLFIISKDSIESPYCADEVEYAQKQGKRIVTVLYKPVDPSTLHPALAAVQWIDFKEGGAKFDVSFSEVIRTLDTDREHVQSHTKWQNAAMEWILKDKTKDLLLRGSAFSVAEVWLQNSIDEKKNPQPTEQQKEFLQASRDAIYAEERKRKRSLFILRILTIFSLLGMIGATYAGVRAYYSSIEASNQARIAKESELMAKQSAEVAEREKEKALAEKKRADEEKKAADIARTRAEKEKKAADKARAKAVKAQKQAMDNAELAAKNEKKAINALDAAQKAKKEEELANKRAIHHLYMFNGKEMANKSLMEEQSDELRALLALTGYELMQYGIDEFADVREPNASYSPQVLESLQRALLFYQPNELKKSSILALSGGTSVFLFADNRNQITWARLDKEGKQMKTLKSSVIQTPMIRSLAIDIQFQLGGIGSTNGAVLLSDTSFVFKNIYWHKGSVLDLQFIPEKKMLISAGVDKYIRVYDVEKGKVINEFKHTVGIRCLALAKGRTLFFSDINGAIWKKDMSTDEAPTQFSNANYKFYSTAYFAPKNWLIAGTDEGRVLVFDLEKQNEPHLLTRGHNGAVSSLSFNRKGTKLTTASLDGSVFLWDLEMSDVVSELAPVSIQYPDALAGTRKVFTVKFLGEDYLLLGDNNSLRVSTINIDKNYGRLRDYIGDKHLSNELWKYYIQGDLKQPRTGK